MFGTARAWPKQWAWGLPLLVPMVGMFMSILDVSTVNVAIPTIQKEFGSTTEDIQWTATAYSLALGLAVLTAMLTRWQAQQFADRAALIPPDGGSGRASNRCGAGEAGPRRERWRERVVLGRLRRGRALACTT
jgi:MFS family permease